MTCRWREPTVYERPVAVRPEADTLTAEDVSASGL